MFEARDGSVVIFVTLKNPRWTSGTAHASAAASIRDGKAEDLTATIRRIKAGQDKLLPNWIREFGRSDVYVISKDKSNPQDLLVLGPKDDKNYIAVFTDRVGLEKADGDKRDVLQPAKVNGKALLKQASNTGRGLIINATDPAAAVPLPAKMMAAFIEGIGKT